jgi:hypothetical protein
LERARAAGLSLDGVENHEKLSEFLLSRYEQERPYIDLGRQSLASQPSHQNAAAENDSVAEEQPPEFDLDGHFNGLWSVPQIEPHAQFLIDNGAVQLNPETGLYEPKPGLEAMVLPHLNNLNQAHVSQKQNVQNLFKGNFYSNLDKGLWPAVEYRVQKLLNERINGSFQQYQQQQSAQGFERDFISQHKAWLYAADGRTFTEKGKAFTDAVAALQAHGMTDPAQLAEWAMLRIGGVPQTHAGNGQQEAGRDATAPAPNAVRAKDPVTGQFVKTPAGTPAPVSKQESFLDSARKQAGISSNQAGYNDNGSDAVIGNNDELENMWGNAWNKHRTGAAA